MSNRATATPDRYRPNVTVACVIEAENRFLLVEEWIDGEQKFNQPAGHLEAGETLSHACAREVHEETGLIITPQHLLRIDQFSASPALAFLRFTFGCQLSCCQASMPQDSAISATHWLSYDEICQRSPRLRSPLVMEAIHSYQQGQRYPLSLLSSQFLALAGNAKP
ncbi:NUDIX hydrolase [Shewanella sp. YIC-542]|uniref:NUDIX hydrolase n=1 Tax=Shewanella mytili TaxID=3377111 RepID=UPI00398E83D8